MRIIKNKNKNKENSTSRRNIKYIFIIVVISLSVLIGMIFLNIYFQTQELGWSHRDLSTGNSQTSIQMNPRPNVFEVWDRDLESIAEGDIQFISRYEEGTLSLQIFIASINRAETTFILTGNSGLFLTISNFSKYLDFYIWNKFNLFYSVEFNDYELTVNDVVVESGKFNFNADWVGGFRIQTSLPETLLMYVDIISLS